MTASNHGIGGNGGDHGRLLRILPVSNAVLILVLMLVFNCSGQFEHFRNHESVFKEYTPFFESAGANFSTVTGQTVTLKCDVRNLGDRYVSWFRASDSQVLSTGWTKFTGDRRFKVLPADRSHTWGLRIKNLTTTDTGAYLCQVNTEPRITLPFHISITESFAVIPGGTSERFVQLGSELRLRCRISKTVRAGESPPRISWFRNGTKLSAPTVQRGYGGDGKVVVSPVNFKRHDSSVESSLTIESVTLSDSGIYKCTSDAASEAQVAVLVTSGEHRAAIVDHENPVASRAATSHTVQAGSVVVAAAILLLLSGHAKVRSAVAAPSSTAVAPMAELSLRPLSKKWRME